MNRELLARVRDRIAEVGNEHCNMGIWSEGRMVGSGEPDCGTTACIAGHTIAVSQKTFHQGRSRITFPGYRAQELLALPSRDLFYRSFWPERFHRTLEDEGDAKGMLAICDALLDGSLTFDANGNFVEVAGD